MEENNYFLVRMKNIAKSFGTVQALKGVNFEVYPKEIVGLIGDNAAGKSTLMKILVGAYHYDEGEIYIEGKKKFIDNPKIARELGIGIIYQDSGLIGCASVDENIF
ncbi:MAG: ATP-binding cassette domain-containing protein, partial [Actinobacteria bacterium]|nr:ATP-binding cassette domain-containing protein [Actinomycetota bacterium]